MVSKEQKANEKPSNSKLREILFDYIINRVNEPRSTPLVTAAIGKLKDAQIPAEPGTVTPLNGTEGVPFIGAELSLADGVIVAARRYKIGKSSIFTSCSPRDGFLLSAEVFRDGTSVVREVGLITGVTRDFEGAEKTDALAELAALVDTAKTVEGTS